MKRFELSINTKFGGNSIIDVKELLEKANDLRIEGIGITDFNDINAFFEIDKYKKEYPNLKIIYGTKINVIYKKMKIKIDILVKNKEGLKNLYQVLTLVNKNDFDIYELFNYSNGLFIGLNITKKEIYELLDTMVEDDIYEFIKVFDYLIVTPFKDHDYIKNMVELTNKYHKFLIVSNDIRYLNKEDKKYYELYKQKKISEDNYLMNIDDLYQEFSYLTKEEQDKIIINNPHKISLLMEDIKLTIDDLYKEDKLSLLKDMVYKKANELFNNKVPAKIKDRIEKELSLINNKNAYSLLISKDLVELSNKLGYETSTRGGIVSFYINYLLGITKINPLDYNLDYKEFIKDKNKNIVMGINFDSRIKNDLLDYLNKNYNITRCGTIGKTYEKYLREKYNKKLTSKELNKLLDIKRVFGKLVSNYFILPKDIDITLISPLIDLNDLTTMIDYHYIESDLIRVFIAELNEIEIYNELYQKLNTITDYNDNKVWESINKESISKNISIKISSKVSNIKELAKEWQNNHQIDDWTPSISYGIEYSIIYYKIAYMKYYNREIFDEIIRKYEH